MSEDRTQVPDQSVIYPQVHSQHIDFSAGGCTMTGVRFAIPDRQDCDYQIINYEDLAKLLPDPKPGRVELGLLPDGSAYAPKTATKDNFLLFPSKASYILYFTHHYFSRENLNRDHTFLSMMIDKLVLPLEKLVKAPRLAALHTTTEDVEWALTKSKIVCIEEMENGIRGVRRIDGYPASLLSEGTFSEPAHSGPSAGCFSKPFIGSQFNQPVEDDTQQFITPSDVHGNCVSVPNSVNLLAPNSIIGSTSMVPAAGGHLVRVPSGQPNHSQGIAGCVQSLSSCTNTTPSDNLPIVTSLPNAINAPTLRPNTAGTWPYQPQPLFVVGPPYNRQGMPQTPTIGAVSDNTALIYGLSQTHQASSLWGMRARYPYPPSQPYNGSIPLPVPSGDSQLASGLPVRPPTAGHLQHYLFGHPNPPNAYPNSLPIYPINPTMNPLNLTMANAFAGQPTNQHRQQTPAPLPPQYAATPFFAGNAGHFASVTAGAFNTHPSNVSLTNSYIGMALATMAATQQQQQTAGSAATSYFHSPLGMSPQNPYQANNAVSPVPIVYAAQPQLPLQLTRHHHRLPPPQQVSTVYALSTPYQLPQTSGNPTAISPTSAADLCGPQSVSNSRTPDALSSQNYINTGSALFSHPPASGCSSQTVGVSSSPLQTQQQTTVSSPVSSLHSSGQISNFHSVTSIPNLVASSLAAAAAGLNIQYPPGRPSTVSGAGTNPFGGTAFNLNMSTSMIPTSYCDSPLPTVNSGSSGVGSKSDTPNVDLKTDDLNVPKHAHQDDDYAQTVIPRAESSQPLANDIGMPSEQACVNVQQALASDGAMDGGGDDNGNLGVVSEVLNNSPDDSTDDSASSGIAEMNTHCVNGSANAGDTNANSHPVGESATCDIQERRQMSKNNYVFVSCKRSQKQQHQQVIPVKEANFDR